RLQGRHRRVQPEDGESDVDARQPEAVPGRHRVRDRQRQGRRGSERPERHPSRPCPAPGPPDHVGTSRRVVSRRVHRALLRPRLLVCFDLGGALIIYELRTYPIKPGMMPEFLRLTTQVGYAIRGDRYGKLVGNWSTELGGLNRYVHLWDYEGLDERDRLRTA